MGIPSVMTYVDRIEEYVETVIAGSIPVSENVMHAVHRHRRDRQDSRFELDAGEIEKALGFIETRVPYCRGDRTGELFQLQSWQIFVLGSLVGWRWADTGRRRFRFAILELARGQGKTTMMAALLVYNLLKGAEGSHCFTFGTAERVALLAFNDAKAMMRRMGNDTGSRVRPRRTIDGQEWSLGWRDIRCEATGTMLEALCAKEQTLDGLDPTYYIADECAEFSSRAYDKLHTATVKRQDSVGVMVTTPGSSTDTVYYEHRTTGLAVLNQEHDQPDSFYYLCGVDEKDDISDVSLWPKAMPSLGVTCQLDDLERRYQAACKSGPSHVRAFCRFHLCQWVGIPDPWLELTSWNACNGGTRPDLTGRRAWAGLDLSKSRDMSSLVTVIEGDGDKLWIWGQHWYPEDTAREREGSYRCPLLDWGLNGHLHLVPGGVIDYEAIEDAIRKLHRDYKLEAIWTDPMFASQMTQSLTRDGIPMGTLKQSIQYLSPGTIKVEELVTEGRLLHDGDPVLRSACQEARVYVNCNNDRRLDKARSTGLIDSAMALVMAVSAWDTCSPESTYEHKDLRILG